MFCTHTKSDVVALKVLTSSTDEYLLLINVGFLKIQFMISKCFCKFILSNLKYITLLPILLKIQIKSPTLKIKSIASVVIMKIQMLMDHCAELKTMVLGN